ncbi:MAG: glycosyltransferase [Proteobacteria bacterium]|nr:glycosyltransferase [Pseudomonadota bacterium]
MKRPLLVVFATLDPRGNKIGGIETHIRHILRNHPKEVDLLLVGIDEAGDLETGKVHPMDFDGRAISFFPLACVPAAEARVSASRLTKSTTLRFVLGGLRHLGALRHLIRGREASVDLPRVEFALLPWLLGIPYILGIHADLGKVGATDSLLKRYGLLKRASEAFALRKAAHVFAVNPDITAALLREYPALAGRIETLPVPVDTAIFRPTPFSSSSPCRIVYAGRLDEVKDPELMFAALAALERQRPGEVAFHLVGSADPGRFAGFAAIERFTIRHGAKNAGEIATILRDSHCALMTSHSEGLPCFLLETLASGRAFVATDLPTFRPFVKPELSGALVARKETREASAEALAGALEQVATNIETGMFKPERIAASVAHLSVSRVFEQLFARHALVRTGAADHSASATIASHAAR